MKAPEKLRLFLREMYYELLSEKFRACQVPDTRDNATEGHNIWVAESQNPDWYKELIRKYPKNRKSPWLWGKKATLNLKRADSKINRPTIIPVLERLSRGLNSKSKYAADLIRIARKRQKERLTNATEAEIFLWEAHRINISREDLRLLSMAIDLDEWTKSKEELAFLNFVARCIQNNDDTWKENAKKGLITPF